jgi:hypothetical protein
VRQRRFRLRGCSSITLSFMVCAATAAAKRRDLLPRESSSRNGEQSVGQVWSKSVKYAERLKDVI